MTNPEIVVVTGASAGVGRAVVRRFAGDGAHIALLARGRDGLEAARREVEDAGGRALVVPTDVADHDAVEAAAARAEAELGPIDVWVNSAMVSVFSPAIEMTAEEYRRVTDVTYLGVVHGTLAALRRMRVRNRGSIVQVASALSYRGIPLQSAYCAAKHAVQGFMDSLRCELLHERSGVRLSSVHLPAVNTPQFDWVRSRLDRRAQPVPPVYQPELAAEAIHWAAHNDRREVWFGLPTVAAILGDRLAPALLDRYLAATAVDAQQTAEPEDPDRPDNLWEPLAGDRGAHGRFDVVAHDHSPQLWATTHRGATVGALLAAIAGIAMGALSLSVQNGEEAPRRNGGLTARDRARLKSIISMRTS
jgi:NAD(P)-dependent dehydrogenase (short-subunit alcohol dehydrogenase family)